ncbi:MAG TPA: anti-sigma factor [Actinoplanes sp.]|jgi:anti-sigma-K factor RskA
MTATDIHALVGAYALDAVDDLERAAFEKHLLECASCRAEATELQETVARLADTTWSVPSPRLRTEVMAAVSRTRQVAPAAARVNGRETGTSRWRTRLVASAAAVVLAFGTGAAVFAVQQQRVRDERAVAAAAQVREARIRAVLAAPDLVVRTSPMVGGGRVTVASAASQGAAVVSMHADTAPSPTQAYQFWTIRGTAAPASADVLDPGEQAVVEVVRGVPGNDTFAVSLEPAGGSLSPSDIRATVNLV